MQLNLSDYLTYLKEHKNPSTQTLARYQNTLTVMQLDIVDTDKLPSLYKQLLGLLPTKGQGYVRTYLTILSAWIKKNGQNLVREITYYTLQDEIKKLMGSRDAYSDDDLVMLFAAVKADGKNELNKAMVLMLYSGLRIGACYPLYYDQIEKVEGQNVYTYEVVSKGSRYNAVISGRAFEFLKLMRLPGQKLVVQYDQGYGTPFPKLYRDELNRSIIKHNLFKLRENTSIFHSIRKSYSQKLLDSELNPADYTYKALMGHIPKNTTATKYYITPEGKKVPLELIKRCADAYAKTRLMTMEVGL